jgi:predicted RNA-binding protein YlxR (DUF448 family)
MTKVPRRSCVTCRREADKSELMRIVRDSSGSAVWDPSGKAPGRGAYLCESLECFELAAKRHLLDRALRIRLDGAAYRRLGEERPSPCSSSMVKE